MLVASWWLFSIVMGATYSGNLIAFLTVQLETQPFHSLEEMLDQDTYIWGTVDKTATYRLLMVRVGDGGGGGAERERREGEKRGGVEKERGEVLHQDSYIWGTVDKTATYKLLMVRVGEGGEAERVGREGGD